jgi:hypothetical protein
MPVHVVLFLATFVVIVVLSVMGPFRLMRRVRGLDFLQAHLIVTNYAKHPILAADSINRFKIDNPQLVPVLEKYTKIRRLITLLFVVQSLFMIAYGLYQGRQGALQ